MAAAEPSAPDGREPGHRNKLLWIVGGAVLVLLGVGGYLGASMSGSNAVKSTGAVSSPIASARPSASAAAAAPSSSAPVTTTYASSTASSTATSTASPSPTTPTEVVQAYFAAINAHDYALAWSLGGRNLQQGSFASFVQGFASTANDTVDIVSASGDMVTVQLNATHADGTHQYFAGTYTVRANVIVSANVQQQ